MTSFVHVVGRQGVGKSTLILALAARYQAQGLVCAGQDPNLFVSRAMARQQAPDVDVCFIEHQDERTVNALPGELVIRLHRA